MSIFGNDTDWSRAQDKAREDVNNSFGTTPTTCQSLDSELKRLKDLIIKRTLVTDSGNPTQKAYLDALNLKKNAWESLWATQGCSDVIEKIRLQSTAIITTKSAIKSEDSVLKKNKNEQFIYIGIGSLVLFVGLYIVLKK